MAEFKPSEWFSHLFGFRESVEAVQENFEVVEHSDHVELMSKVNNKSYCAGQFQVRNISSFGNLEKRGGGTLNIIHGHGRKSGTRLSNVLETQAEPDFDGATFLAASNFNCLEFVSGRQTAADGVTNYIYDQTQGPYTALAAGPAAVYRNYFIKHSSGKIGQLEEEVQLLKDTPLNAYVTHGYPFINEKTVSALKETGFDWSDLSKYYVGVHSNCEVTTKQVRDRGTFAEVANQMVHQVYAAAFNFAGSVSSDEYMIEVAKNLLKAEYQATVLAAWENSIRYPDRAGSKKLVLTLLGGGVFANPVGIVCEAIRSAEKLIIDSGLEVYVVCFDDNAYYQVYPNLRSCMTRTGGKVVDCKE